MGLPRLHKAALLKATSLGSLSGWHRASLDLCTDTEAHGHHPPHHGGLGRSRSRHTQTLRGSRAQRDGLSGRLMHHYSDQGKRKGQEEGAWSPMHRSSSRSNAASQDSN